MTIRESAGEEKKIQEELTKFQSYDPTLVDMLRRRKKEYQNQLALAEQVMQKKSEEFD